MERLRSAGTMKIEQGKEYEFHKCLYEGQCADCESKLEWEAYFDADGTQYFANCCGKHYWLNPSKVIANYEETSEE